MGVRSESEEHRLVRLGERLRNEKGVYPLQIEDRYVLFRLDGVIFEISKLAYDLLSHLLRGEVNEGVGAQGQGKNVDAVREVVEELLELDAGGWLETCSSLRPAATDPKPLEVQPSGLCLLVSQTCNLDCRYCYAGGGTYGGTKEWMDFSTACRAIRTLLDRSPDRRQYTLIFFGGEPLLNISLIRRVVGFCEQLDRERDVTFNFSLTTNATILTERILRFLVEKRFVIMASYDSRDYHDELRPFRNGRGSGKRVRQNLRRLIEAGLPVQIRGTVVRDMIRPQFLEDFAKEVREFGGGQLVLSSVDCSANPEADFAIAEPDKDELQQLFAATTQRNLDRAERREEEPVVFDPHILLMRGLATGTIQSFAGCGACLSMTAASTDGKLYPCHRFVGKPGFVIGDVDQGLDGSAIESFFRMHQEVVQVHCEDCFARRLCSGMCYNSLAVEDGQFRAPTEEECKRVRTTLEEALRATLRIRDMTPESIRHYSRITRHLG